MSKKYYAVRHGRQSGVVVKTWDECKALTTGFAGAAFKGFSATQRGEAYRYAEAGSCLPSTKQRLPSTKKRPDWDEELYPCIERLDFRDTLTGVLYRNRCRRRGGPTVRGDLYKPHIGNSLPWRTDAEETELVDLQILNDGRQWI
jgi:hypothetical protein